MSHDQQTKAKIMNMIENLIGISHEEAMLTIAISKSTGSKQELYKKQLKNKEKECSSLYDEINNDLESYL